MTLLILEINRKKISQRYPKFNEFFRLFIDERDREKFVMTHFYLLIGSLFPVAISFFKQIDDKH